MSTSRFLAIWLLVAAIALGIDLGGAPLLDADEGRNGEVGREMAATNDYVVPRLNGLPYLDKPILYFAAEALVMEVLGPTETAARLPAYLFTILTAGLMFWWARRAWGSDEAYVSAIMFLAMPLTIAFARTVIFDSALSFFVVLAIVAFHEAVEARRRGDSAARWSLLAWVAIGFGVLTKGPVAIALPLLVAVPYGLWRRAGRAIWSIGGLVAFVVVIAPWLWAMQTAVPDFLHYALVTETAARLTSDELKRTGPPWFFLPYILVGAIPWSVAALTAWRRDWRTDPRIVFLMIWVAVPFLFFSLSQSKLPQYILPLMPPIAFLVAQAWREMRVRIVAIAFALLGVLLVIAPLFPQFTKKMKPIVVGPATSAAYALGAIFLAGGVAALIIRRRDLLLVALSAPILAIPLVTSNLMDALGQRRSARSVIAQLSPHLEPDTQLIGLEAFTGSLAFYARRPIAVVSTDATEYTSNYLVRRYDRFIDAPQSTLRSLKWFESNLQSCCQRRIYIVRNSDRHHRTFLEGKGMRLLAEGSHHVAYGIWTGR